MAPVNPHPKKPCAYMPSCTARAPCLTASLPSTRSRRAPLSLSCLLGAKSTPTFSLLASIPTYTSPLASSTSMELPTSSKKLYVYLTNYHTKTRSLGTP
ncbi:hypothetical protein AMTR_s00032p00222910 [Amborella trichopoda]|uniref:Uncharacterized protein n=1 Tax=Amborella trichopoda TaxID=13333 RepID=U5CYD8_AMBTC|nr:hypothetical protein AMTR_s00032p00222910 [Amborella trichopoda]